MVGAVLLAPFLAVFAQKQIEIWRSDRERKLSIFKSLMATRGATLSPQHVQALNMIDLEFSGKDAKEREVKSAWKEYLDHLAQLPSDPEQREKVIDAWVERKNDYLTDLLQVMGKHLGYNFDKVHIKRGFYTPEGHARRELDQNEI